MVKPNRDEGYTTTYLEACAAEPALRAWIKHLESTLADARADLDGCKTYQYRHEAAYIAAMLEKKKPRGPIKRS